MARIKILCGLLWLWPAISGAQAVPLIDTALATRSADNDPDLIVARERFDAANRTQSLYIRVYDGTGDGQVFSGRIRVRGASIVRVLHTEAELRTTDDRWGIERVDYAGGGEGRGLDGIDPFSSVPAGIGDNDALRIEGEAGAERLRFWMSTGSEIDDFRVLIRYPVEPGPATFDVELFGPDEEDVELRWPSTTQGGVRIGSPVDAVPDDGDYSEAFSVRNVKLRIEDFDVREGSVAVGEVPEVGGTAGPGRLTLDNFAGSQDFDMDNGFDQNGLISPIPSGSDLEHMRLTTTGLVHTQVADLRIAPETFRFEGVPARLVVGDSAQVSVFVDVPPGTVRGVYVGRVFAFEDNSQDGLPSAGEPIDGVTVSVIVGVPPDGGFDLAVPLDFGRPDGPETDAPAARADLRVDGPADDAGRVDGLTDGDGTELPGRSDAGPGDGGGSDLRGRGDDGRATDLTGSTADGPDESPPGDGGPDADASDGMTPPVTTPSGRSDLGVPRGGALSCDMTPPGAPLPLIPWLGLTAAVILSRRRRPE